jgi:hypothetical protein
MGSVTGVVRCRVCRCSEDNPCNPPCAWAEYGLCTSCALVVAALAEWSIAAHWPNRAALWREVAAAARRLGE